MTPNQHGTNSKEYETAYVNLIQTCSLWKMQVLKLVIYHTSSCNFFPLYLQFPHFLIDSRQITKILRWLWKMYGNYLIHFVSGFSKKHIWWTWIYKCTSALNMKALLTPITVLTPLMPILFCVCCLFISVSWIPSRNCLASKQNVSSTNDPQFFISASLFPPSPWRGGDEELRTTRMHLHDNDSCDSVPLVSKDVRLVAWPLGTAVHVSDKNTHKKMEISM